MAKEELYSLIRKCVTQVLINEGYKPTTAKAIVNWNYHEIISIVEREVKE